MNMTCDDARVFLEAYLTLEDNSPPGLLSPTNLSLIEDDIGKSTRREHDRLLAFVEQATLDEPQAFYRRLFSNQTTDHRLTFNHSQKSSTMPCGDGPHIHQSETDHHGRRCFTRAQSNHPTVESLPYQQNGTNVHNGPVKYQPIASSFVSGVSSPVGVSTSPPFSPHPSCAFSSRLENMTMDECDTQRNIMFASLTPESQVRLPLDRFSPTVLPRSNSLVPVRNTHATAEHPPIEIKRFVEAHEQPIQPKCAQLSFSPTAHFEPSYERTVSVRSAPISNRHGLNSKVLNRLSTKLLSRVRTVEEPDKSIERRSSRSFLLHRRRFHDTDSVCEPKQSSSRTGSSGIGFLPDWISRRFRETPSPTPVAANGIGLFLRKPRISLLRQFGKWKDKHVTTSRSDQQYTTNGSNAPSEVGYKDGSVADATFSAPTHEVIQVYQELIQNAEGDRLSTSAAHAWREISTVSECPTLVDQSPMPTETSIQDELTFKDDRLTRPQKPDHLRLPPLVTLKPQVIGSSTHNNLESSVSPSLEPLHDAVSVSSGDTSRDNLSNLSPTGVPPIYSIIAQMLNILSQHLMQEISDAEFEQRFRQLEEVAMAYHPANETTNVSSPLSAPHSAPANAANSLEDRVESQKSSLVKSTPLLGSDGQRVLRKSLLAQATRLGHRKKLEISVNLLECLVSHPAYPSFEAHVLTLLGRKVDWHQISVLYYLSRCGVRYLLSTHMDKLNALCVGSTDRVSVGMRGDTTHWLSNGTDGLAKLPESIRVSIINEMGFCRARVNRMKDFTVTFFNRWYAEWVKSRGGWQTVLEEIGDSEID